jgi:hypothetical protein
MKRALFSFGALAVALLLPAMAHGQSTVNVTATVNPVITPGTIIHLAFGSADPGQTVTINALSATNPQGTRGELPLTHNTQFTVGVVVTHLTDGTTTISDAAYYCAYTAASGGTDGLQSTTGTTLCSALPQRNTTSGTTYIMIGGNVPVPANATAGNYLGSLVFTITAAS